MNKPLIILYNPQCAKPSYQRLPLSVLQVGALLEDRYHYELIDGNLDQEQDRCAEIIAKVAAGVRYLGITVMPGPQLQNAVQHIRRIKAACPGLTIIVGGYFPTSHPNTCALDRDIDYVVVGPGEETFRELIDALESGGDPSMVAGLAYERGAKVIQTPKRMPLHPNDLPWFPYHKVPVERYVLKTCLGSRTLSHHSSFGCPFFCNFCAVVTMAEGRWKAESPERLGELAEYFVDQWQINALEFHDNNFFTSEKRIRGFCEQLLARKLSLHWWGEGRIDTMLKFKSRTWELMRASGLKMVFLGAESGDDETLQRMNKGGKQSAQMILQMAQRTREYRIVPEFSFILGNPPAPREDLQKGIAFIRRIKQINPASEIIMYRYDPVPLAGEMLDAVEQAGFRFPTTLDEWADPHWQQVQRRVGMEMPWLSDKDQRLLRNFQTVLNAYYPTTTDRRLGEKTLLRQLLRGISSWRYRGHFYHWPVELKALQRLLAYQRPEISGF